MDPSNSASKWQTATANEHTCDAVHSCHDRGHTAKRVRTLVVSGSRQLQVATVSTVEGRLQHDDAKDDAVSAAILTARLQIRDAIKTRSVILLSYGDKPAALIRPTSWVNEPYTFWARHVHDKTESATTYSLSVAKINDCVSFDE